LTLAASALETYLDRQWPLLTFQRHNCRPIAGTRVYSQHAWPGGNARDIFGPVWMLDRVANHLRTVQRRLGIKQILWRVKDHYDHVHADMWPTGIGIPPCAGGTERYRYSTGKIVAASGGNVRPEGMFMADPDTPFPFTPEEVNVLKALAPYSDFLVAFAQAILNPGPTTGKFGSAQSLLHVLEVFRETADIAGISPLDHENLARRILDPVTLPGV
jgi:hypothetical protein